MAKETKKLNKLRVCSYCMERKTIDGFSKSHFNYPLNYKIVCKKCISNKHVKSSYGRGKLKNMSHVTKSVDVNDVGYLYMIKIKFDGRTWYKVGKTNNLERRLQNYNYSFPYDIFEYDCVSIKMYNLSNLERLLIEKLESLYGIEKSAQRREWFRTSTATKNRAITNIVLGFLDSLEEMFSDE